MTDTKTVVKNLFKEGRPLMEQALDIAEQFKAFRELAREKDVDWSQVKKLLKAQIEDERDEAGGDKRVKAIIDKADCASAYADMLGLGSEKNISREFSDTEVTISAEAWRVINRPVSEVAEDFCADVVAQDADLSIPANLRRA